MKILVIGSLLGNIDLVNKYLEESGADVALCTGDMGLFYKEVKNLPKDFEQNNFYEYLEGRKSFHKPIYTVKGPHDNISLCRRLLSKEITLYNFCLIPDGKTVLLENNTKDPIPIDVITIGGIGGSYSPTSYNATTEEYKKRHFNIKDVQELSQKKLNILLMHDIINNLSNKDIVYSDEAVEFIDSTMPFYYFVGKYNWWGYAKMGDTRFVSVPNAQKGYFTIDTNKEWRGEGIRYDMNINVGGMNDTTD